MSLPLHGTALLRISRGVTQWARQSSEVVQDMKGMDTEKKGVTAVAKAQPEDPDLCIGRPSASHREITPTTTRPIAPRPAGFRQAISAPGQTHRNEVKLTVVKDAGKQLARAKEIRTSHRRSPKNSREFSDQSRIATPLTAPV